MTDNALSYLRMQEWNILLAIIVLFVVIIFIFPLIRVGFGDMSQAFRTIGMDTFFASQGANILTLVVMFLTVIVLFKILGVDFNPKVDKHIAKVVTVESMSPMGAGARGMCGIRQPNYPFDEEGSIMYDDASYYKGKIREKSNMTEN